MCALFRTLSTITRAALELAVETGAHALADELTGRLAEYEKIP